MNEKIKEMLTIVLAIIILAAITSYKKAPEYIIVSLISFFIIITINIYIKKLTANSFEADITIKPWSMYYFGFRRYSHFKEPVPMIWVPIFFTLLTNAKIWWLAVLQFDVKAKPERTTKRDGLYRFTEMTDWDIGLIALSGLTANIIIGVISYIIGIGYFEYFAKLNIYYATWSLLPISNLDGTKILFGSKTIWIITTTITLILAIIAFSI